MNVKFWKATIAATVVALVIEFIVHNVLLMDDYQIMQLAGVLRPMGTASQMLFTPLLILLGEYIMCEFLEKLDRAHNIHSIKHGVQFGVLFTIPSVLMYLYYNIPFTVPVLVAAGDILAFGLAAKVYHKLNPHPKAEKDMLTTARKTTKKRRR